MAGGNPHTSGCATAPSRQHMCSRQPSAASHTSPLLSPPCGQRTQDLWQKQGACLTSSGITCAVATAHQAAQRRLPHLAAALARLREAETACLYLTGFRARCRSRMRVSDVISRWQVDLPARTRLECMR